MSELIDIIISAVDQASETFESIVSSADDATSSLEGMSDAAEVDSSPLEETADATHDVEEGASGAESELDNLNNLLTGFVGAEVFNQMADALWDMADRAGGVQDSILRLNLAAEGAGIPFDQMTDAVSKLASETGRAGGQIRESFITMTSAGISDMNTMQTLFKGASAQAFILGTDVDSLTNKFAGMAMKSSIAEKTLKGTGITVEELGQAMGIQGATIDDVNAKWETLTVDQKAALLGQAASMNEGKEANEAYKNSWEGLQNQIEIAKGKLEVMAGKVLLPVLVPALKVAANVLNWLGGVVDSVMNGPMGGFVSAIGAIGAGIALAVPAFMALSAAWAFITGPALAAAAAMWAAVAPLLPFIAIGAAIVYIIYEIGKAFNWWDDAGSMIDAISDGLQRLWNAFINHPDVQAALEALGGAFEIVSQAVMGVIGVVSEFFGVSNSGNFDIVRALIDGIGDAWNAITLPLRLVIGFVQQVINVFNLFRTGQMDLPTFIMTILTTLANAYNTIFTTIISLAVKFGSMLLQRGISAATRFVNGIINRIRQLPGRVYSALLSVVSRISSAIQAWISTASAKVQGVISAITSPFRGVAGAISGALSGVASAITAPFQAAWDRLKPLVDKIKDGMKLIGAAGGEPLAAGGETAIASNGQAFNISTGQYIVTGDNTPLVIEDNINLTLDLRNVPRHIDTDSLIVALSDKNVLNAIASNRDFQSIDANVKRKLNLKNARSG